MEEKEQEKIEQIEQQTEKEEISIKERLKRIHKLAAQPMPLSIDEVALAFIACGRVENWDCLGEKFGGHKIGAIYAYIMDLISNNIEKQMSLSPNFMMDSPPQKTTWFGSYEELLRQKELNYGK